MLHSPCQTCTQTRANTGKKRLHAVSTHNGYTRTLKIVLKAHASANPSKTRFTPSPITASSSSHTHAEKKKKRSSEGRYCRGGSKKRATAAATRCVFSTGSRNIQTARPRKASGSALSLSADSVPPSSPPLPTILVAKRPVVSPSFFSFFCAFCSDPRHQQCIHPPRAFTAHVYLPVISFY